MIYLLASTYSWYILSGQIAYIFFFIKKEVFLYQILRNSMAFSLLTFLCCILLGLIPALLTYYGQRELAKISIAIGAVLMIGSFYLYCTPRRISELGWKVKGNFED